MKAHEARIVGSEFRGLEDSPRKSMHFLMVIPPPWAGSPQTSSKAWVHGEKNHVQVKPA
jgi:hypothetical protein